MKFRWIICLFGFAVCFSQAAKARESVYSKTQVEIFADTQILEPNHSAFVLVKITPRDDWHIYWDNPGDTGMPTKVELSIDNAQIKLKDHSYPKHFVIDNIMTQYAYDDAAYWLFKVVAEKRVPLQLSADVFWLACRDECISESMTVSDYKALPSLWEKERLKAQKTFAQTYENGIFSVDYNTLRIFIPNLKSQNKNLHLVPYMRNMILPSAEQKSSFQKDGGYFELSLNDEVSLPKTFPILILGNDTVWHLEVQEGFVPPLKAAGYNFYHMLFMAFIGGLILNFMPCIFPILFLKAIHLINNAYSFKKIGIESLLYFSGVIISFIFIAGLLWLLRRGGENIGWGFQLQSPVFIACLFVLFFIIGLMFTGILNFSSKWFNTLSEISIKNKKLDAFCTGLFAVLIASPCSAPFMGVAIGYSITQPLFVYFPIFMALAVGYALPFTLIGLFPRQVVKILPKPGHWMVTLKRIFAIPVFLTCLWLGWVFYNQIHQDIQISETAQNLIWQPFSEDKIFILKNKKQPFFIDFTAKWCLTCLLNERTALSSQSFAKLVKRKNIALFKADWTNKNEVITKALEHYHRNSVPLYIYYNGTEAQPVILPQLLTPSLVKKYLK